MAVGLGNPEPYARTRHNAGIWWIDEVARRFSCDLCEDKRFCARWGQARVQEKKILLAHPRTYMNESGRAVQAIAAYHKIAPEEMLLVHDEMDLEPGAARLKKGGSAAGHRGVEDVARRLGTPDFWRLRLGIGRPVRGEGQGHVLGVPTAEERALVDTAIARSLDVLPHLIDGDFDKAMQELHKRC